MSQNLQQIFSGILLILLQVFLFNQMTLFGGTPYVFLIFLFFLPLEISVALQYLIGFSAGLLVDVLSLQGPIGLHAFAATFFMGVRTPLIQLVGTTAGSSRMGGDLKITEQQWVWYLTTFLPLVLLYLLLYVFLEAMTVQPFWGLVGKVLTSGSYTFFVCMILWYIFYRPGKNRSH